MVSWILDRMKAEEVFGRDLRVAGERGGRLSFQNRFPGFGGELVESCHCLILLCLLVKCKT